MTNIDIYILGIETSCDNTAIVLICNNNVIYKYNINQNAMLSEYGGYIPHMLAEKHSNVIESLQEKIINNITKVEYIAVTTGPGLKLSLCIGYKFAKFLSKRFNKKIFYADHIEAHIISYRFCNKQNFPFTCLLVSGGHTLFLNVLELGKYSLLSKTIDDAVGEIFDKLAKKLNLNPQNGEGVEKCAKNGKEISELLNINIKIKNNEKDLSFSGIKTKFIRAYETQKYSKQDICYTFQQFIANYICKKILYLINTNKLYNQPLIICGGVANNKKIYNDIQNSLKKYNVCVYRVNSDIACDNAEMIAWLCYEYVSVNKNSIYSLLCRKTTIYPRLCYEHLYNT